MLGARYRLLTRDYFVKVKLDHSQSDHMHPLPTLYPNPSLNNPVRFG